MGVANLFHPHHRKQPPTDPQDPSGPASATPSVAADERVRRESWFRHLLNRPEFAALAGTAMVFIVFGVTAGNSGMFNLDGIMNWSQVAAYLGLIAVGACVLMIAGEFDLSIGSMIGFAGMMVALPTCTSTGRSGSPSLFAFVGSMLLGALNGYLVMRTRLPSFIVTLAFLFILRGLTPGAVGDVRRPHHHLRHRRRRAAGLARAHAVPGGRVPRAVRLAGSHRPREDARQRHAARAGYSQSRCCGGSRWPSSARSRWRRPASATGSSRSAATRTRPRTSACRCGA